MLVLARKAGETICIGGQTVVIQVVEIRGDKVRLGITARKDLPVHRGEVQERIDAGERMPTGRKDGAA